MSTHTKNDGSHSSDLSGFSNRIESNDNVNEPGHEHDKIVGFMSNGGVRATHLNIPGTTMTSERDASMSIPVIQSTVDKRIGIGFNPETGKTFLIPDDETMNFIKGELGDISSGYFPADVLRGLHEVSNVRKIDGYFIATVQENFNMKVFDAKQKLNGTVATLVPERQAKIEIRGVTGQSNAVLAGTTPVVESRSLYPYSALSFDGKFFAQGGSGEISGNTLVDFVPVYDAESTTNNQLPATMAAFASEHLKRSMGGSVPGQIVFTAAQGSVAMSALLPGTVNWKNYFTFLSRAKEIAKTYGRDIVQRYVTIIHGETGNNWTADFTAWANAIIPAIKNITKQSEDCKIVLWQITGGGNGYENGVGALQLAQLDSRSDIIMPGPMYGYPTTADRTHLNAYGRMMMGEAQGYMERMIENGFLWRPLRMKSAIRNSNTITVNVDLPPGVTGVKRDYDWMPDIFQDGFVYANDGNGAIAITNIRYVENKIILTLASTPTGKNERLNYGLNNSAGTNWPWYGGMVMAESNVRSPFNELGHPIPKYIRHYMVREKMGVTTA